MDCKWFQMGFKSNELQVFLYGLKIVLNRLEVIYIQSVT